MSDKIIKEEGIINSIEGYKTIKSEERKTKKLVFANRLARYFVTGYFILFALYIILPLFGFSWRV